MIHFLPYYEFANTTTIILQSSCMPNINSHVFLSMNYEAWTFNPLNQIDVAIALSKEIRQQLAHMISCYLSE